MTRGPVMSSLLLFLSLLMVLGGLRREGEELPVFALFCLFQVWWMVGA